MSCRLHQGMKCNGYQQVRPKSHLVPRITRTPQRGRQVQDQMLLARSLMFLPSSGSGFVRPKTGNIGSINSDRDSNNEAAESEAIRTVSSESHKLATRRALAVNPGKTHGLKLLSADRGKITNASEFLHRLVVQVEIAGLEHRKGSQIFTPTNVDRVIGFVDWWNGIVEPERSGWLFGVVTSKGFEFLCIAMIIVNSIFIALESDWEMHNIGRPPSAYFLRAECVCGGFFLVELFMRLWTHRLYYFVNDDMVMNIFDILIVSLSSLDLGVAFFIQSADNGANMSSLRLLRIPKLAKVLRAFRAMRFFKDLAVIMEGMKSSMVALFMIFIMLALTIYMFSLIFMQSMVRYLESNGESLSDDERATIDEMFGSIQRSTVSLYMAVTGGNDWSLCYDVVAESGAVPAVLFLFFTFFFTFAMFNILTALFVEKVSVAAEPGKDELVVHHKQKYHLACNELRHLCQYLDKDASGTITWDAFKLMMTNPVMVAYLASIGLEVHEPVLFFSIICDQACVAVEDEPCVSIEDFVDGCMRMKGSATSIDAHRHQFEIHMVQRSLEQLSLDCRATLKRVEELTDQQLVQRTEPSTNHYPTPARIHSIKL